MKFSPKSLQEKKNTKSTHTHTRWQTARTAEGGRNVIFCAHFISIIQRKEYSMIDIYINFLYEIVIICFFFWSLPLGTESTTNNLLRNI